MTKEVLSQCHLGRSHARLTSRVVAVLMAISACVVSLKADPAIGDPQKPAVGNALLTHVSQGVALRYWLANPTQAPAPLQER